MDHEAGCQLCAQLPPQQAQSDQIPPPPQHTPTIRSNVLPPWVEFETMNFVTGQQPVEPYLFETFNHGISQLDNASESQDAIEAFHRVHSNDELFGPLSNRATQLESTHHAMIDSFHWVSRQVTQRSADADGVRERRVREAGEDPLQTPAQTFTPVTLATVQSARFVYTTLSEASEWFACNANTSSTKGAGM